jgi:hypothetical protein
LSDGDRPLDLPLVWRKQFDGAEGERLRGAQHRLIEATGVTEADLAAMSFTRRTEGLAASAMSNAHREMLDAAVGLYVNRLPDDVRRRGGREVRRVGARRRPCVVGRCTQTPASRTTTGCTGRRSSSSTTTPLATPITVHTVWRDPRGDFADDPLARHRAEHHHG